MRAAASPLFAALLSLGACAAPQSSARDDAARPQAIAPSRKPLAANCAAPVYAIDHLVCADPDLLALDLDMSGRIARMGLTGSMAPSELIEDQGAWFRRRSLCAFQPDAAACTRGAYRERLAVLDGLLAPAIESPLRVACAPAIANDLRAWMTPERVVLVRPGRAILGVALPYNEAAPWRPFLTFTVRADGLELRRRDDAIWRCRLQRV